MKMKLEIPLSEEEWSVLNAAADSIFSSPEELARLSLVQRCLIMSEDDEIHSSTRDMIGMDRGMSPEQMSERPKIGI